MAKKKAKKSKAKGKSLHCKKCGHVSLSLPAMRKHYLKEHSPKSD